MEIHHLNYFIEVAKHRSFTKAAQQLHVTQPTISKMVKDLEEELGVVLLNRSGKSVQITDAGLVVKTEAEKIVAGFRNLATELADVMNLDKGTIRLGLPPMVGATFFPNVIAEFHHRYPNIILQVIEEGAKGIEQQIEAGNLDLGVAVLPVDESKFTSFSFLYEDLLLLVHQTNRLASQRQIELGELRDEPFILFREDFALHDRISQACIRQGFTLNVVCKSSQWDFIRNMVQANLGVALLPRTMCQGLDTYQIKLLSLTEPIIPWHLGLIWKREGYISFASRAFITLAQTMLTHV